jgi:hypothetical protein
MRRARSLRALAVVFTGAWLLAGAGCATPTAEKTAATALSQLATYERDVGAKVRAESDFYEGIMRDASLRITDLWQSQQPAWLDEELRAFAADNLDGSAVTLGPRLPAFLEATLKSWAGRDQEYEDLLAETLKTLADNRRKLEVAQAQIAELRNKLQPLSEVASDREMLKILIGFARETKAKLDELNAASKPAAAGGAK